MTEPVRKFSMRVAETIDRRRFVRRAAGAVFATVTGLSAGSFISPSTAYGYTSACYSPGRGDPYGCGASDACSFYGRPFGCSCGSGTNCLNNGAHCHGPDYGSWGGTAYCWTCTWYECYGGRELRHITDCCDCKTSSCGDSSGHCISYQVSTYNVGICNGPASAPVLIGVDTGDPSTSWGFQVKKSDRRSP
jgi:hypothetical protein